MNNNKGKRENRIGNAYMYNTHINEYVTEGSRCRGGEVTEIYLKIVAYEAVGEYLPTVRGIREKLGNSFVKLSGDPVGGESTLDCVVQVHRKFRSDRVHVAPLETAGIMR